LSELNVVPQLVGYGTDETGNNWQVVELYTNVLPVLFTPDLCQRNPSLVDTIETQIYDLFVVLSQNQLFCPSVSASTVVYKVDQVTQQPVLKLLDKHDDPRQSSFVKVHDMFELTDTDILFSQMLVFNHNTKLLNCIERVFFTRHLLELKPGVHLDKIEAMLGLEDFASILKQYEVLQQSTFFRVNNIKRSSCSATVCVAQPMTNELQTGLSAARYDPATSQAWYSDNAAQLVGEYKTNSIKIGMVRGAYENDAVFAAEYSCNFETLDRIQERVQYLVNLQDQQTSGACMVLAIVTWKDDKPLLTMGVLGNLPVVVYEQAKPFAGILHPDEYNRYRNSYAKTNKVSLDLFLALNTDEAHTLGQHQRQ
jgi:hypothetical protein